MLWVHTAVPPEGERTWSEVGFLVAAVPKNESSDPGSDLIFQYEYFRENELLVGTGF
jgi:hypothetical protein